MVYTSSLFLLYFLPVFLLLYYLIDKRFRNGFVIAASTFFFAWGAPVFVIVLWVVLLLNHFWIRWMSKTEGKKRTWLFFLILLIDICILLYFKYLNFFIDNLNGFLQWMGSDPVQSANILLPLGISFITFQMLSYAIDVYRKTFPPSPTLTAYAFYILMFPKLLAGPIVRYREMAQEITSPVSSVPYDERINGFFRFVIGLAKKVLIANVLGETVDQIFALDPSVLTSGLAWTGALAYAFQIYFDFSGYSDMAIGLANMMGFRFGENFNNPYVSRSITEFWRRWHISLSNWLRDYLFLPVAYSASRKMKENRYLGLKTDQWLYLTATSVTMVLCGFWHGAAWTFIIWGAYQGLIMILERMFLLKLYKKIPAFIPLIVTFLLTVSGWVVFRSSSLPRAWGYLLKMWGFRFQAPEFFLSTKFLVILILAALLTFVAVLPAVEKWQMKLYTPSHSNTVHLILTVTALILFVISLSVITASGFSPFIYFRF